MNGVLRFFQLAGCTITFLMEFWPVTIALSGATVLAGIIQKPFGGVSRNFRWKLALLPLGLTTLILMAGTFFHTEFATRDGIHWWVGIAITVLVLAHLPLGILLTWWNWRWNWVMFWLTLTHLWIACATALAAVISIYPPEI